MPHDRKNHNKMQWLILTPIGYLRVDPVHQDHQDGKPGVFHINAVDTVTQWQVVGCVETISENHLVPVLESMLHQFPFRILGFHCDNGSEFINQKVAEMRTNYWRSSPNREPTGPRTTRWWRARTEQWYASTSVPAPSGASMPEPGTGSIPPTSTLTWIIIARADLPRWPSMCGAGANAATQSTTTAPLTRSWRSEEHTSELQSPCN